MARTSSELPIAPNAWTKPPSVVFTDLTSKTGDSRADIVLPNISTPRRPSNPSMGSRSYNSQQSSTRRPFYQKSQDFYKSGKNSRGFKDRWDTQPQTSYNNPRSTTRDRYDRYDNTRRRLGKKVLRGILQRDLLHLLGTRVIAIHNKMKIEVLLKLVMSSRKTTTTITTVTYLPVDLKLLNQT